MASINQVVSEIAHSLSQPNNYVLRENIKNIIIHTRNEIIRHSYEQHGYVDKGLTQRYKVTLTEINDGEIELPEGFDCNITKIKRTTQKVQKPVRLTNNLPFDRVGSVGFKYNKVFPFIKESSARFRKAVPGLCGITCYDYINGYIYLFPSTSVSDVLLNINTIVIESVFEHPSEIQLNNKEEDGFDVEMNDNEWVISEDMIGQIKDIIYKRDLLNQHRETDEIPSTIKY